MKKQYSSLSSDAAGKVEELAVHYDTTQSTHRDVATPPGEIPKHVSGCTDPNPQLKKETNEKSTKEENNHNGNNNNCHKKEIRNR